jgi:hypothetical protein
MATEPTKVDIPPAEGVGSPFDFDASAFLQTRSEREPISLEPIQEDSMITQAKDRISSLLSGELPEEVLQQVEIRAAERGMRSGLTGEAARNLTFRDLGASAMDAITQGIQAAGQMETLRLQREQMNLGLRELEQGINEAQDRYALAFRESDRADAGIALEAIRLQSANEQFRLSEENRLIVANAQQKIQGLQQNLDTLGGALSSYNRGYQKFIELTM